MSWISVKDRLPEQYCDDGVLYNIHPLLVCLENDCVCEAWWTGTEFARPSTKLKSGLFEWFKDFNPVKYWMEMPEPPKE